MVHKAYTSHTYVIIIFYYRGDDQEQGEEEQEGRLGEAGGTLEKVEGA